MQERDDMWGRVIQRFSIPLLTAAIGFGSSQMLAVETLKERVNRNIAQVETFDRRLDDLKALNEKRIEYIVGLMEAQIKQSTELITLIKVQQQMGGK